MVSAKAQAWPCAVPLGVRRACLDMLFVRLGIPISPCGFVCDSRTSSSRCRPCSHPFHSLSAISRCASCPAPAGHAGGAASTDHVSPSACTRSPRRTSASGGAHILAPPCTLAARPSRSVSPARWPHDRRARSRTHRAARCSPGPRRPRASTSRPPRSRARASSWDARRSPSGCRTTRSCRLPCPVRRERGAVAQREVHAPGLDGHGRDV